MTIDKRLLTAAKIAVSLAVLFFLFTKVDFKTLEHNLAETDPVLVSLAIAIGVVPIYLSSVRLKMVLKTQGVEIHLWPSIYLTFVGLFFSIFLLGSTGGDVAKLYYIMKYVPGRGVKLFFSVMMDRLIGIFVLLGFAVGAVFLERRFFLSDLRIRTVSLMLIGSFILGAGGLLAGMFLPTGRLAGWLKRLGLNEKIVSRVESLSDGFHQLRKQSRLTLFIFIVSGVIHFLGFVSAYLIARSLGMRITLAQVSIIVAVVAIVISLPISIGGHGVREGIFILLFGAFDLLSGGAGGRPGYETAISFSILFFVLQLFWALAGGIIYLFDKPDSRFKRSAEPAPTA